MKNLPAYVYIHNANYEHIKKLGQQNLFNIFYCQCTVKAFYVLWW